MKIQLETITPEKASLLLGRNTENRKITDNHVLFLSKQMAKGDWLDNGETIKINKNGLLLDGQHRLNAIIHSGVTLNMIIVYDLEAKTFGTIDTGRKRSAADVLFKNNKKNHINLAATSRMIIHFRSTGSKNEEFYSRFATNKEIEDMALNNEALQNSVTKCASLKTVRILLSPSISSFLHYMYSGFDVNIANSFFNILDKGGAEINCPAYQLREHLNRSKLQNISSTQQQKIMWTTKYFQMYIDNKKASRFMSKYNEEEVSNFLEYCDYRAAMNFES